MRMRKKHQEAQIGVVAVLLTTVLLVIGVSVGSRVIRQTRDETIRQEATQQLNQAESVANMGEGGSSETLIDLSNVGVKKEPTTHKEIFSSDVDTVYLNQGETVEVLMSSVKGDIHWELKQNKETECPKKPGLLLTFINDDKSQITPVAPSGCSGDQFKGYQLGGSSSNTKYVNSFTLATGYKRLRIEAIFAPTYIHLQGLTTAVRAASVNQSGEEARVVEQTTSFDTPNFVNDFTLFAGNSQICQGKFERNLLTAPTTESDGKPGQGGYICK